MKTVSATGSCLCGAVTIKTNAVSTELYACHCGMCRKWGGGPSLTLSSNHEVDFQGKENITTYSSSAWADRGFCKQCGSHLFYRMKDLSFYHIPVGLFNELDNITFTGQIYIDNKPDYYSFSETTKNMTEADVIAMVMKKE